jgi:tetratricopeptide (TPR) repeat protein
MKALLILLLLPWTVHAQQAGDARALYQSGNFADSAKLFSDEVQRRPGDAAPHYNLGNALYRSQLLGPAVAAYLRAWELDPRDEDIRFNLDFALRKAGEGLYPDETPLPMFLAFHALSAREAEGLQWIFWWAMLLAACVYVVSERKREALRTPLLALSLAWLCLAGWWGLLAASTPKDLAVTVAPRTELRNGPGDGFSVGFTAPEGRRVSILDERDGWLEIGVLKEGVKGWVKKESIEKV